jgi:hypothetical protein
MQTGKEIKGKKATTWTPSMESFSLFSSPTETS